MTRSIPSLSSDCDSITVSINIYASLPAENVVNICSSHLLTKSAVLAHLNNYDTLGSLLIAEVSNDRPEMLKAEFQ